MTKINRELLLGYYNHEISLKQYIIELLKIEIIVNIVMAIALINFIGATIEILYALALISIICLIIFSIMNLFSDTIEKIRDTICINKINRNEFYIIKDSVQGIIEDVRITDSKTNSTENVLKIQFSDKNHWFYADEDKVINTGDEYYIILFSKGIYNKFKAPLINPKIIGFLECKAYDIEYINSENYQQYWKDGILAGKYIK
mgnify:CR=1 FL=1